MTLKMAGKKHINRYFIEHLERIKAEGRYRSFANLRRQCGSFPLGMLRSDNGAETEIVIWCSNDYLGMGEHPALLSAMQSALSDFGAGAGGTRNIAGTHHAVTELEAELADLHAKERALVFTSGYVANEATLSTLGKLLPDSIIFSDAANHASMIAGIRNSGSQKMIFAHNDLNDLANKLAQAPATAPKIIAFESVYSMDGDIADIEGILDLAADYDALTYLDEVHAVGLYGAEGGGVAAERNLAQRLDIVQGTLAKAYGAQGGYIAGSDTIIDCVRSFAAGFIFTTSPSPVIAHGALAAIRHLRASSIERSLHRQQVAKVKTGLQKLQLPVLDNDSHIVPLMVGNAELCRQASDYLLKHHHIYIQPINFPTVARGTERLRITPSPVHSDQQIAALLDALQDTWETFALDKTTNLAAS